MVRLDADAGVDLRIAYLVKEVLGPRAPRPRSPRPEDDEPEPPDHPDDLPGPETPKDTGTEDEDDEGDGNESQGDTEDTGPDPYAPIPGPLEDEIEKAWSEFPAGSSDPRFFGSGNSKQRWKRQLRKEMLDNRWRPGDEYRIPGLGPGTWQPKKK